MTDDFETEVAALTVAGLSDAAIAETLDVGRQMVTDCQHRLVTQALLNPLLRIDRDGKPVR